MRIEDSIYKDQYIKKISNEIGDLYFFERFIVSEVKEGIHFDWAVAKGVIGLAYEHYGKNIKVTYISNRVNSYSLNAQDWLNFYKERHHLEGFAIVAYSKIGLMNVILEKIFIQTRLKKFNNLEKAVNWALSLEDSNNLKATEKFEN